MSGKKVSLIITAAIVLLCAMASASAAPTFTLTVQKGKLGTNTTFLLGESVVVNVSYSNITTLPYTIYVNVTNSSGFNYVIANTTLTANTTGYAGNGTGWLNNTWSATGVAFGKNYTIYVNGNGISYNSINITFVPGVINVTPTGLINASNAVTFYVNVTALKEPIKPPVINLTAFGLSNVTTTYVNETTSSTGAPVYIYKATNIDLSKATYTSKTFSVKVYYTSTVNKTYNYSLTVIPNTPYRWVVLENTTNGVSYYKWPSSDDSAVPASLGATVINATEYIAVADKYGNVINLTENYTSSSYTATIAVLTKNGSLNRTTVSVSSSSPYAAVLVSVPVSAAPCNVTIQPYGSGLVATTKTIMFSPGIAYLNLSFSKSTLYANNTDSAKVYVALKDSKGDTLPLKGVNITISEVTTLGLKFNGNLSATAATNASGIAVFTVTAGKKYGTAEVRAVVNMSSSFPWNGKFGNNTIKLLQAPNYTAIAKAVVPTNGSIVAGVKVPVTITLKDYNDTPIKNCDMYPIKFNITSGDAKWLENNGTCYEIIKTDANGNATATLYTTNATSNTVKVVVSYKNEAGKWVNITRVYTVKANKVHEIAIYYNGKKISGGYAYPVGVSLSPTFTIKYLDEYGNVNKSSGTVKIVPQSSIVGSFSTSTVTLTNGYVNVTFTTNKSAPAGASATFTLNDTTYKTGNVTLKIISSGVKNVALSVSPSYPRVGNNVTVTAKLLGIDNTLLAKPNVNLTMTVLQPDGVYQIPQKKSTTPSGIATFVFPGKLPGKYTVKVYNTTYGISNTTTVVFVGPPVKLVLSADKTTVTNGSTVVFTVKTVDVYGMPSVPVNKNVSVLVNGTLLDKNIILDSTNATAVFNLTFNSTGTYTVYAMCLNNTSLLHDEITINVVPPVTPANVTITKVEVSPTSVSVGSPITITIYAKNTGDVSGSKTVTVSIYNESGLVYTKNVTITVPASSETTYKLTYIPEAAGNYTVSIDGLKASFTAVVAGPPPIDGKTPKDLNGDGLYEDVNGDGHFDFGDVVFFFYHLSEIEKNPAYVKYLDFNKDGKIDFGDVVKLFYTLS